VSTLKITDLASEAKDVRTVELRDPQGGELPVFAPGAHLEFALPNGLVRHYSLTNDCRERDRYVIAVLQVPDSRGGSLFMHRNLTVGMALEATLRNNFVLDEHADGYLFIAGGIGVTPIMSMIRWCVANHRPWRLVYATRDRARTAFYETLSGMQRGGAQIRWHFDDECAGAYLDARAVIDGVMPSESVYCCGPRPLMHAVRAASEQGAGVVVRFESFIAPNSEAVAAPTGEGASASDAPFKVILERSGVTLDVPTDQTILEVLEAHGFSVPFSCREGQCGTCTQSVLDGVPDHRDYVLSDEERATNDRIQVCVSRALTPTLTLDL
jgi:ferredoxin-NADP reductase